MVRPSRLKRACSYSLSRMGRKDGGPGRPGRSGRIIRCRSGSTNANNANNAWNVNFNNGNANNNNKSNTNYVRCVRGGAWVPMESDLFNCQNLERAYLACRRRKRGTHNAIRFEASLLDNLCTLEEELRSRSYRPSSSICFVQRRPKMREIFAADFRDRVVHHLLVGFLEPVFEPKFIYAAYACRVDKGTHGAVKRLQVFLNKITLNGRRQAWYLKEDVSGFFMHIDKVVLLKLIQRQIKSPELQWLAKTII